MAIKELYRPVVVPKPTPQCEAMRQTPYANDTKDTDKQCKWSSRFEIDGHFYCTKHAGQIALRMMLETQGENDG